MKKILFAGYGTDTVHIRIDGDGGKDHRVDGWAGTPTPFIIRTKVEALYVFAQRDFNGNWFFGVGRIDAGTPLPRWRVAIGTEDKLWGETTAVLIIEVPLDAEVSEMMEEELADAEPADKQEAFTA